MGDDFGDVKAPFDHVGHFVPGVEDFSAEDSEEVEPFEDDEVPVDNDSGREDAEESDVCAVEGVFENCFEGGSVAGHF